MTIAPSATNASAMARPMPWPAAVTSATFPCRRMPIGIPRSMIVARHRKCLRDALIFDGRLEHHARGELIDHAALDFLPWRLTRWILVAATLLQRRPAPRQFGLRDQYVGAASIEVDAYAVSGLEHREAAAGRCFRRGVEDRRRARGAGLAAVADAGQGGDSAFDHGRGWLHVHDLRRARIADRADATDEEDGVFVDLERGIVDAVVIVFRPVEHDGAAFECIRVLRVAEIALAEF